MCSERICEAEGQGDADQEVCSCSYHHSESLENTQS